MTFLEFVTRRLLGPPVSGSCWHCPYCNSSGASFSIRPPKGDLPIKFKCFRCEIWGDEADLMKELMPGEDWPRRRVRLDQWRREYEADQSDPTTLTLRGSGREGSTNHVCIKCRLRDSDYDSGPDQFGPEANAAIAELLAYLADPTSDKALAEMLTLAQRTLEICTRHRLHPRCFAGRIGFEVGHRESLREHAASCNDPLCGDECRVARGLPPLTAIERAALKQELEEEHAARMEWARSRVKRNGRR